jgi:4-diphosphocytidyl-2-C-methyl-D-erythritol kinase
MSETIRLLAMAKLNLFLRVVGVLEDGFHEIETVFHSVRLCDVIELSQAPPGEINVEVQAPAAMREHLPAPEQNLVSVAAHTIAELTRSPVGAAITVIKNIPVGAGLAGGSADAAAALVGLNALWNLELASEAIVEVAAGLGSDVPFCVDGGTALATGRGTDLIRLPEPFPIWFVLGISDDPLMTAAVYEAWDQAGTSRDVSSDGLVDALAGSDTAVIASSLHNDLCSPAARLRPQIHTGIDALLEAGALGACVSGSGPTVFGIADGEKQAVELAQKACHVFSRIEVVSSAPAGVEWIP